MKNLRLLLGTLLMACLASMSANAGNVEATEDGTVTWQAGVDGVEIEWAPDGNVNRIYSRFSTPVEFADRRGINKAQIISEEKAKAAIIRFFSQSITSTRIITEIQSDINTATQIRQTGAEANVVKQDERTLLETLTEVTTSFAQGSLSGVIVLERGYDEVLEEAWVVVGISQRTINAARQAQGMLSGEGAVQGEQGASGISEQGTEVRTANQDDW